MNFVFVLIETNFLVYQKSFLLDDVFSNAFLLYVISLFFYFLYIITISESLQFPSFLVQLHESIVVLCSLKITSFLSFLLKFSLSLPVSSFNVATIPSFGTFFALQIFILFLFFFLLLLLHYRIQFSGYKMKFLFHFCHNTVYYIVAFVPLQDYYLSLFFFKVYSYTSMNLFLMTEDYGTLEICKKIIIFRIFV